MKAFDRRDRSGSSTRPENGRAALHVDVGYALHPMTQFTDLVIQRKKADGRLPSS